MKEILDHIKEIKPVDTSNDEKVQKKLDSLTKPPGSLGRLEEIVKDFARSSASGSPQIQKKTIFVMAGDHGVAESGVSAFPAEVTPQMVLNFLNGGAAINVLARHSGCETKIVDMGVKSDFKNAPGLIVRKIGHGTKNIAEGPAMTEGETVRAVMAGIRLAEEAAKDGTDIIGTGEMGIANTTPATAIFCALLGFSPRDITGSGTGLDEKGISRKAEVIQKALKKNEPFGSPLETLMKLGGFEIAGIVGLILGGAKMNVPVVVDGFISTAAAVVAMETAPYVRRKLFFAHLSNEKGHKKVLGKLDVKPILDFDMRLGEGTGAALAISIIDASLKTFNEMATFESAGVSDAV
ncbi:MAG: nicotinate-nucleotide--dimethylbenzimidazole phosphoribosyltransferase [Nitrospinota bacterium]